MLMILVVTHSGWSHNGISVSGTSVCVDNTGKQARLQEPGSHGESGDRMGVTDGGTVAADRSRGREDCLVLRVLTLFQGKPAM